jgi:hypothetical protein
VLTCNAIKTHGLNPNNHGRALSQVKFSPSWIWQEAIGVHLNYRQCVQRSSGLTEKEYVLESSSVNIMHHKGAEITHN